nr:hypothetical protein [Tanacetum cinerariifolium]
IPKFDFDFEEEIRLIEKLLYDNSFPRPPEELNAEIADTIIESIPLPIPVQDGEEIAVVMIDKDKFDDDYQIFMFDKVLSLLFAESEDTIFDPGLSPMIEAFLCWICVRFPRSSHPSIKISVGKSISF